MKHLKPLRYFITLALKSCQSRKFNIDVVTHYEHCAKISAIQLLLTTIQLLLTTIQQPTSISFRITSDCNENNVPEEKPLWSIFCSSLLADDLL